MPTPWGTTGTVTDEALQQLERIKRLLDTNPNVHYPHVNSQLDWKVLEKTANWFSKHNADQLLYLTQLGDYLADAATRLRIGLEKREFEAKMTKLEGELKSPMPPVPVLKLPTDSPGPM